MLEQHGIYIMQDAKQLIFEPNRPRLFYMVSLGIVDVGIVDSDVFQEMADTGKVAISFRNSVTSMNVSWAIRMCVCVGMSNHVLFFFLKR